VFDPPAPAPPLPPVEVVPPLPPLPLSLSESPLEHAAASMMNNEDKAAWRNVMGTSRRVGSRSASPFIRLARPFVFRKRSRRAIGSMHREIAQYWALVVGHG
jgi:hypothetical protein